jgi:hypothetical protein
MTLSLPSILVFSRAFITGPSSAAKENGTRHEPGKEDKYDRGKDQPKPAIVLFLFGCHDDVVASRD